MPQYLQFWDLLPPEPDSAAPLFKHSAILKNAGYRKR
ncbi:Uncharacterised protein [Cardiobacterium valvarum]|uniref:Uncharacterized protein n=1 Tax=Cardiobacterium valvarum TaxID=194702 RepID=A0A381E7A1_9GAMM|nr:Uncharacterised protein [Cardiobacterium valvarum]